MKKLISIMLIISLAILLSGCTKSTPYEEPGLSQKEVEAIVNQAILEDRLDTEGKIQDLNEEIASLEREVQILELKNPIYNYDYTDYYLNDWTDEQLYAAVKRVFDDDNWTDEQWNELIMEIIDEYDLIDVTEDKLQELFLDAFIDALETQAADEVTE